MKKWIGSSSTEVTPSCLMYLTTCSCAQTRVGAAQLLIHSWKTLGEAFDVQLINNRVVKWHANLAQHILTVPIEVGIDDHALGHERSAVPLVEGGVVPRLHLVAEYRRVPLELAGMSHRVGIEQQLVGVEAVSGLRFIGPVHPIAVDRTRADVGQIAMPDLIGVLRQFNPLQLLLAVFVE